MVSCASNSSSPGNTGSARLLMVTIGARFADFSRGLAALYARGAVDLRSVVDVAKRHGVCVESDRDAGAAPA